MNEDRMRGFVAAREFLISQAFLWAAVLIGSLHYASQPAWAANAAESAYLALLAYVGTYVPVQYLRLVWKSWRVWRRKEPPPEVTVQDERTQREHAEKLIGKMVDVNRIHG